MNALFSGGGGGGKRKGDGQEGPGAQVVRLKWVGVRRSVYRVYTVWLLKQLKGTAYVLC